MVMAWTLEQAAICAMRNYHRWWWGRLAIREAGAWMEAMVPTLMIHDPTMRQDGVSDMEHGKDPSMRNHRHPMDEPFLGCPPAVYGGFEDKAINECRSCSRTSWPFGVTGEVTTGANTGQSGPMY